MADARLWDLFCRVVDNFGDVGVCWRLGADLAARGQRVRLWVDDPAPLAWMAPAGCRGVEVVHWAEPAAALAPGDVVIEAFGCHPPPEFVDRMARREPPPLWLNLEYLSAEPFVERNHGLPSPQPNGSTKWFFYPGFSAGTGGLLREPGLLAARAAFDRDAWLAPRGLARRAGERVVTLFCYDNPALPALLQALAGAPTLLLLTPGHAQRQVHALPLPAGVRTLDLPWLSQVDFDRLLWCGDFNLVRGEDSLVRAIWAGSPFLWQLYPQHDGAHGPKLEAFVDALGALAPAPLTLALRALARRWNGLEGGPLALPPLPLWASAVRAWRDRLAARADLTTQLLEFRAG